MLVDLQTLPPEGQAIDRTLDASALSFDASEFRIAKPVSLHGHLTKADDDAYRLEGELASAIEISCVRCLESFESDVRETLNLLYLPQSRNVSSSEDDDASLSDDDLAVSFYTDDEIDLAHMIWEQITLALPMKPICKSDCQGLCPSCGVNRNETTCSCVHDSVDPRWESLKGLIGS